jgi:hypothetical protein
MNYEIVRYHPDLKAEIIKLQTHLWGPDLILNASYFECESTTLGASLM